VEYGNEADLGAEMTRIGGDCAQVSVAALNRMAYTAALFWKAILAASAGRVKTTWKYGTGSNSAWRSISHALRAGPWHFAQWRFRHEL
jgi:ABC-type arginine/histidine transport system permease subunit